MFGTRGPFGGERATEGRGRIDRRDARRAEVVGLVCDRGLVIDLSVRGMRIASRRAWSEGQARFITLRSGSTSLRLPARCVWARRESLWRWTVGLAFDGASAEQLRLAGELATLHEAGLEAARRAA